MPKIYITIEIPRNYYYIHIIVASTIDHTCAKEKISLNIISSMALLE